MKIQPDTKDKIIELICLLLLLTSALIIGLTLPSLPDIVPIHFNFAGEPDGYGSKYMIWAIFGVSVVVYIGLTLLSRFPGLYKNRITVKNVEEQYRLTVKMVRALKVILLFFFTLIAYLMTQTAQLKMTEYSNFIVLFPFVLIFPTIIYYLIKLGKVR